MTPDARAARERKQKIFVVVGGIFLLAMLALQLPKFLGGSGDAVTTAAPAPGAGQPGEPGAGAPVALTGANGRGPALPGKLTTFGTFKRKNPFVQLVVTDLPAAGGGAGEGGKSAGGKEGSKSFSLDGKARGPALTIVSVNGSRQTLEPGAAFPEADPVFVLVSEQPKSKSVVIGVVGGAYASGSRTTKLKVGKPLTLVNTTTGAKYKVKLVSVGSGEAREKPAPEEK